MTIYTHKCKAKLKNKSIQTYNLEYCVLFNNSIYQPIKGISDVLRSHSPIFCKIEDRTGYFMGYAK